jgi:uncharacterized protein YciI
MLYSFKLLDKPTASDLRLQMRPQHKAYLAQMEDRIAFAGPLTNDDGLAMVGSLLVIDFDSREHAQAWLNAEPFHCAGLYACTSVHAFVNLWPQKAGFPANP